MMEKDYNYHDMIKKAIFGISVTDQDITTLLFKIGWAYIFFFVLNSVLGKFFGAKAVAPYGKFADSYSYLTALRLNAKLAWIIQEMPAFVISILLLWEAIVHKFNSVSYSGNVFDSLFQ